MKKLFISQPMAGRSDEEILTERAAATKAVELALGEKVEVLDSFFQGAPAENKPLWYLGKSLERMSEADLVYFARGWNAARGCRLEYQAALGYGLPYMIEGRTYQTGERGEPTRDGGNEV